MKYIFKILITSIIAFSPLTIFSAKNKDVSVGTPNNQKLIDSLDVFGDNGDEGFDASERFEFIEVSENKYQLNAKAIEFNSSGMTTEDLYNNVVTSFEGEGVTFTEKANSIIEKIEFYFNSELILERDLVRFQLNSYGENDVRLNHFNDFPGELYEPSAVDYLKIVITTFFDNDSPDFIFDSATFVTNVDNPATKESIKSNYKAYDKVDGWITERIEIIDSETNYTGAKAIGDFKLVLSVTDLAGNATKLTIDVIVLDTSLPTIVGPDKIESFLSNPISPGFNILDYFDILDNYDPAPFYELKDIDNFENSHNVPGIYTFKLIASDSSQNTAFKDFSIVVVDNVPPIISGPLKLNFTTSNHMKKTYLLSLFSSSKAGEINLIDHVDSYFRHVKKTGTFTETLSTTDVFGNEGILQILIENIDNEFPIFAINKDIYLHNSPITTAQIVEYLGKIGYLNVLDYEIVSDKYVGQEKTPGIYQIEFRNGPANNLKVDINVLTIGEAQEMFDTDSSFVRFIKLNWISLILLTSSIIILGYSIYNFSRKNKKENHKRKRRKK